MFYCVTISIWFIFRLTNDFFTLLKLPIIIISCIIEKKYYLILYILEQTQVFLGMKTASARVNAVLLYKILRPLCPIV
jgi:hypothetical protein